MQKISEAEFDQKVDAIWLAYLNQASQMDILKSVVTSMYNDEEYRHIPQVRDIPAVMYQRNDGNDELIEHPEDFENGMPFEYAEKIYTLFDEYEVIKK